MSDGVMLFAQVHNEEKHIPEWFDNMMKICDSAVILDDGSTDGTYELLRERLPEKNIIRDKENDWSQEVIKHVRLYSHILDNFNPSHIFTTSADERIPALTKQL